MKPGGFLIYSTCSIDPDENQERVEAFLLRHPVRIIIVHLLLLNCLTLTSCVSLVSQEFSVDPVDRFVPSSFVTSKGFFLSNPVKHSLDGAFAARLVRAL